jgi:hypothetical protein
MSKLQPQSKMNGKVEVSKLFKQKIENPPQKNPEVYEPTKAEALLE